MFMAYRDYGTKALSHQPSTNNETKYNYFIKSRTNEDGDSFSTIEDIKEAIQNDMQLNDVNSKYVVIDTTTNDTFVLNVTVNFIFSRE